MSRLGEHIISLVAVSPEVVDVFTLMTGRGRDVLSTAPMDQV